MSDNREAGNPRPGDNRDELVSATLLCGGLRTIRCSLNMVLEQARCLQAAGRVDEAEVVRLEALAAQFESLLREFHRGAFLGELHRMLEDLRKEKAERAG